MNTKKVPGVTPAQNTRQQRSKQLGWLAKVRMAEAELGLVSEQAEDDDDEKQTAEQNNALETKDVEIQRLLLHLYDKQANFATSVSKMMESDLLTDDEKKRQVDDLITDFNMSLVYPRQNPNLANSRALTPEMHNAEQLAAAASATPPSHRIHPHSCGQRCAGCATRSGRRR